MNFYTLFPPTENVHLIKDVGMYPECLAKYEGVDAHLVCYENGKYPYLGTEVIHLRLDFMDKKYGEILDGIRYIRRNAKDMDVLNIYHLNLSSFFYALAFRKYKKNNAILYLKLDADLREIDRISGTGVVQWIKRKTIRLADLVTVESKRLQKELNNILGDEKIQYLPDGIDFSTEEINSISDEYAQKLAITKDNIVLTVGRLGTEQKNTEKLVLEFVERETKSNNGYKLWLVGSATAEFLKWLEDKKKELAKTNSDIVDRIEYLGSISDRNTLNEIYQKSKIFALPSRWESFGIVLVEAMWQGCYLMTTDEVPSTVDLMYGLFACEPGSEEYIVKARKRVVEEFSYQVISSTLVKMIDELR